MPSSSEAQSENLKYCEAFGHTDCVHQPEETNRFGEEFQRSRKMWTTSFCLQDTDSDGKTNGDELGDPCCEWNYGDSYPRVTEISHPNSKLSVTTQPSCYLEGSPEAPIIDLSNTEIGTSKVQLALKSTSSCVCAYKAILDNGVSQQVVNNIRPSQLPFTFCSLSGTVNITVYALNLAGSSGTFVLHYCS